VNLPNPTSNLVALTFESKIVFLGGFVDGGDGDGKGFASEEVHIYDLVRNGLGIVTEQDGTNMQNTIRLTKPRHSFCALVV
jgi:hypothetical protein